MLAHATDAPRSTRAPRPEPAREGGASSVVASHVARLREPGSLQRLELPVLPDVAHKVWAALEQPDADARLVSGILHHDTAFASHVLRIANSPAYAARTPIRSLQQAVSRLGVRAVGEIAIVIAVKTRSFRVPGHEAEVRAIFHHSLVAALHAREIARLQKRDVEQAFVGALLHDLGRPTLIQALVDHERESASALSPDDLERIVDELHAEVGAGILDAWGLPPALVQAVRHHHHPEAAVDGHAGAALIALADVLAHSATLGAPSSDRLHGLAVALNLYPEEMARLVSRGGELVLQADALL